MILRFQLKQDILITKQFSRFANLCEIVGRTFGKVTAYAGQSNLSFMNAKWGKS